MTWDPESDRYRGKIRLTVPGGTVRMDFELKVQNPRRMTGKLTATSTVSSSGVSDTCNVRRGLTLQRLVRWAVKPGRVDRLQADSESVRMQGTNRRAPAHLD